MNSLSKSISEIFNGRKIESKSLSEHYLLNNNTGSKKYYNDLLKDYNLTPEYRTEDQVNKLHHFILDQNLKATLNLINKDFFVIHKISEKTKVLKFFQTNKSFELNYELHFFQNKLFCISICISNKQFLDESELLHQLMPNINNNEILKQSYCIIDKNSNIIMAENKLLHKIYLFNKTEILQIIQDL